MFKNRKFLFALILALVVSLALFPSAFAEGETAAAEPTEQVTETPSTEGGAGTDSFAVPEANPGETGTDNAAAAQTEGENTSPAVEEETGSVSEGETGSVTEGEMGSVSEDNTGSVSEGETGSVTEGDTGSVSEDNTGSVSEDDTNSAAESESGADPSKDMDNSEQGEPAESEGNNVPEEPDTQTEPPASEEGSTNEGTETETDTDAETETSDGDADPAGSDAEGSAENNAEAGVLSSSENGEENLGATIPVIIGPDFDYERGSTGNAGTEPISYIDADGNKQTRAAGTYVVYNGTNKYFGANVTPDSNGERWIVVKGDITIDTIYIVGNVHMILCDGAKLTVTDYGVKIPEKYSLSIYAQENFTGELTASGNNNGSNGEYFGTPGIGGGGGSVTINGGVITAYGGYYAAGIGTYSNATAGEITINGGADGSRTKVTSIGGAVKDRVNTYLQRNYALGGAGIGGGGDGSFSKITINGGTVNATGGIEGAGIGMSSTEKDWNGSSTTRTAGEIYINGGVVTATGGKFGGAGIGGGEYGATNGKITITGGVVNAFSAQPDEKTINNAAGIGAGGYSAQGGDIEITGGTVYAVSYSRGAGIGGGANGSGDGFDAGKITISGDDTVVYAISAYGAGIGGGGAGTGVNEGSGGSGGNITINGGTVVGISALAGAGIGGGNQGAGGRITINGGTVYGFGGATSYNWNSDPTGGIGGDGDSAITSAMYKSINGFGYDYIADFICSLIFDKDYHGAGIGAGSNNKQATVVINGGTVIARAGSNDSSAIGSGNTNKSKASVTVYVPTKGIFGKIKDDGTIQIVAAGRGDTTGATLASLATKYAYAKITPKQNLTTGMVPSVGSVALPGNDGSTESAIPRLPIFDCKVPEDTEEDCRLTLTGIVSDRLTLYRNGVLVDEEGWSLTTASDGTAVITFTDEFLASLEPGEYTFTAYSNGVAVATVVITIVPMSGILRAAKTGAASVGEEN